ncbi:hypothetical protein GDO81_005651 [Engystomops pustulosus]|uniref:Neuferricin n=1 Tax=Engystomops pustulosus TaxID=76066 RepID=A0AAV7CS59_ENGPU|nr:hypothetical protein GDO81_005651 [Engystomops pustulosus]
MFGYLAAAALCLVAVLVLRSDPWSLCEVPGLSSLFPEQCRGQAGRLLSKGELSSYDGGHGSPGLYLAVLGQVFDVQKGMKHYGPGGSYSFFTGKLIGHFYDEYGNPTKALEDALAAIDVGLKLKEKRHEENKQFPPCNSEFSSGISRVWCSKNSGGIQRDWVGVPRKLYLAGFDGYRCVCVRATGPSSENPESEVHDNRGDLDNPSLKEYKDCNPLFDWCLLKE